jgi:thymidine phosphorylase
VVQRIDVRGIGVGIITLGGGRARESDPVDHAVGLTEVAALGESVGPGSRPLAFIHARDQASATRAADSLTGAFTLGDSAPAPTPAVLEIKR